jgi:hypothetical protein
MRTPPFSAIARRYGFDSRASCRNGGNPEKDEFDSWTVTMSKSQSRGMWGITTWRNSLLLEVILTRTSGLATGERAFVLLFASVNACVSLEMATGGERLLASRTEM